MKILLFIVFGILGGVIGGMGMGGGTILIPLLTIFLNVNQHVAQAINLIAFLPMSVVALIIHFKNKLVDFKCAIPVIIPAVITAILGAFIAQKTDGELLRKMFGGFLMILSVFQFSLFVIKII